MKRTLQGTLQRTLQRWQDWRESRALRRRAIPDLLWRRTLKRFPFLPHGEVEGEDELRRLTSLFLHRKEFTGAGGLKVSDDMAVAIAAQACLPVLRRGLQPYAGFVGVVLHAGQSLAPRSETDEGGVVHEYQELLAGETLEGGPVTLSWRDVRAAGATARHGYNVVVHEFAHVLAAHDGLTRGLPRLPQHSPQQSTRDLPKGLQEQATKPPPTAGGMRPLAAVHEAERTAWALGLQSHYERFCAQLESGPEPWLDPYGAENLDEFFAVASEAFFVAPLDLQREETALYALLQRCYLQDPAQRMIDRFKR